MIHNEPIISKSDMFRCVLCLNAPCDVACDSLDPSDLLRSIWFRNEQGAVSHLPKVNPCIECEAPCEKKCLRPGEVPIRDLVNRLYYQVRPGWRPLCPPTRTA